MLNTNNHNGDKYLFSGWHWSFGWLRRPEVDNHNGFCYEAANGDLIFTKARMHRRNLFLDCWIDKNTGERYLAISKIPRNHDTAR
jgi:hypothetical protein